MHSKSPEQNCSAKSMSPRQRHSQKHHHATPSATISQPQIPPHILLHNPLILLPPLPPHLGRLDIGRTLIVRLSQHTHDANQDLLDTLDGRPPLRGVLVVIRIVAWWMENGYADNAGGVDFLLDVVSSGSSRRMVSGDFIFRNGGT